MLGTKFRIIPGYEGTAQINIAMERGEVHGNAGIGWVSVKTQSLAWLTEGKAAYREFIMSMLDVTDNIVDGVVVPPRDVVRHDGDDAYACDTCCEARSEHFAPDDPPMCEPLCLLCAKLASNCECTGGPMTDPTYREPVER